MKFKPTEKDSRQLLFTGNLQPHLQASGLFSRFAHSQICLWSHFRGLSGVQAATVATRLGPGAEAERRLGTRVLQTLPPPSVSGQEYTELGFDVLSLQTSPLSSQTVRSDS